MSNSSSHVKALEILEAQGAFECEEFLAGKIGRCDLAQIVNENRYDRHNRGIINVPFEQCLSNVWYA